MANKTIIVIHPDVTLPNGKKAPLGECSIEEKVADKLVARKLAKLPEKGKKVTL